MRKILHNELFRLTVLVLVLFLISTVVLDALTLKRYLDGARVGIFVVLFCVTAGTAWRLFWSGSDEYGERVAINMALMAFVVLFGALWVPVKREMPQYFPDWIVPGYIDCFLVLGVCIYGIGFLMPIGRSIGVAAPRNMWLLFIAGALGLFCAGLMVGLGIQSGPS